MPFVYLEVRDTFNPSTNSFMSNNPGSKKALFKATLKSNKIDDKPFVKFSGDRAIRTLNLDLLLLILFSQFWDLTETH